MKWVLVLSVLIGDFLNIQKKWHGFLFWIITDGTFCVLNLQKAEYAESCIFGLYTAFAFYGIYKWRLKNEFLD